MSEYPGFEEAKKLGYSLCMSAGDKSSASYGKDQLVLHVSTRGLAEIKSVIGLVTLTTGMFSFPHPRFRIFENQMTDILTAVKEYEKQYPEEAE